jgi:hypothetical protein
MSSRIPLNKLLFVVWVSPEIDNGYFCEYSLRGASKYSRGKKEEKSFFS